MGALASGLQGIGNVGENIAQGKQIRDAWRQQQVMDKLNAFTAQARLQELQQKLKNTPEAQIATVESILGRKLTDPEKSALLGVPQPATAPQSKVSYQTLMGPDGKAHRYAVNDVTKEKTDLGESYEKPEPAKEPKLTYQTLVGKDGKPHRIEINEETKEQRDLGVVYEKPEKETGGEKPQTLAQKEAEFNRSLSALRTQLSQAFTGANEATNRATTNKYTGWMVGLPQAQTEASQGYARAKKAYTYMQSQKKAVLSGQVDLQDVSDRAQSILEGSDSGQIAPSGTAGGTNPAITIERDANGRIIGVR